VFAAEPFAALPHPIPADPRPSSTDVRALLALLYFAKARPDCWPSDPSVAPRIGRPVGTVQRCLRKLETLGLPHRRSTPRHHGRATNREVREKNNGRAWGWAM